MCGGACCLAERGSKAPGSKYLPHNLSSALAVVEISQMEPNFKDEQKFIHTSVVTSQGGGLEGGESATWKRSVLVGREEAAQVVRRAVAGGRREEAAQVVRRAVAGGRHAAQVVRRAVAGGRQGSIAGGRHVFRSRERGERRGALVPAPSRFSEECDGVSAEEWEAASPQEPSGKSAEREWSREETRENGVA